MAGNSPWGPKPPQGTPTKHPPGGATGEASLGGAVGELHHQHPHHVQAEGLHHKSTDKRHKPVGNVYRGS